MYLWVFYWIATLRAPSFVEFNNSVIIAVPNFYYRFATRLFDDGRVDLHYRNLFQWHNINTEWINLQSSLSSQLPKVISDKK